MAKISLGIYGLMTIFFIAYALGVRINISASVPEGIYVMHHDLTLKPGEILWFCPPPPQSIFALARARGYLEAGFCPGGYGHLMKIVKGSAGDVVTINRLGVWVNGKWLADSRPLVADGLGRHLPFYRIHQVVLKKQEFLLMTDHSPTSFDARYFGILHFNSTAISHLQVMQPWWIW